MYAPVKTLHLARTVVVYEYISGKHAFVTSATNRKKVSHVGAQILYYNPAWPVAMAECENTPDSWTFALLDAPDIVYVFKPSDTVNFGLVSQGCYSIPSVIRDMLRNVDIKKLIERYESELLKGKVSKKVLDPEKE